MSEPYSYPTKKAAVSKARELLRLFPKNWTLRVHENLGWHFAFINKNLSPGLVTVHYSNGKFWCLVANSLSLFNDRRIHFSKDPIRVIRQSLKHAQANLDELAKQVRDSKKALPDSAFSFRKIQSIIFVDANGNEKSVKVLTRAFATPPISCSFRVLMDKEFKDKADVSVTACPVRVVRRRLK